MAEDAEFKELHEKVRDALKEHISQYLKLNSSIEQLLQLSRSTEETHNPSSLQEAIEAVIETQRGLGKTINEVVDRYYNLVDKILSK